MPAGFCVITTTRMGNGDAPGPVTTSSTPHSRTAPSRIAEATKPGPNAVRPTVRPAVRTSRRAMVTSSIPVRLIAVDNKAGRIGEIASGVIHRQFCVQPVAVSLRGVAM